MVTRADKNTPLSNQDQIYSDFLTDLNPHPVSKDIVKFINERAVARSIRNLLSTNRGDRLYQPDIGSDLSNLLFEQMTDGMATTISNLIYSLLEQYEPRAKIIRLSVVPKYDRNLYDINMSFMIINSQEPFTLNVALDRAR
jgi:phage baseplate assembly protein W